MGPSASITLRPGEKHTLSLKGRGAAGYSWSSTVEGDEGVVAVAIQGAGGPPPAPPGLPQAASSADEQATIEALRPGRATIRFAQRRSWQPEKPPLEQHVVEVRVLESGG
jgi:predicted secreted protein